MLQDKGRATIRHKLADRLFHWVMAGSVFVLGLSAFLPILGVRFGWLPWHWVAGIVLAAAVVFHLFRVLFVQGIWEMTPGRDDVVESARSIAGGDMKGLRPAKYDAFQKGYHFAAAVTVLTVLVTGLLMLAKIDTTFWNRNPAILSDASWGIIYVLHGVGALFLLFLVIVHIYFGLLPEHRSLLVSMVRGTGPEYSRKDL